MNCRFCHATLSNVFANLVNAPASNSYLTESELNEPEVFFPLKIYVCDKCKLVQVDEYKKSDDIFNCNYAYFSSFSTSWLEHAKKYVAMITTRLSLDDESLVTEIAANDGYLLQYFQEVKIPCLGIEPTRSTAEAAREKGIDIIEDFFGERLANTIEKSDLILGNNVLAHVPDINDFVKGLKVALKDHGTITMEFPHLLNLIRECQFDTIYHEHFSYLSFYTVQQIFNFHGLKIYDVEQLTTHGGSLRIYACHSENHAVNVEANVEKLLIEEEGFGLIASDIYTQFQQRANKVKYDFIEFLIQVKRDNKKVAAYGAAAKGNTLLNFAGVKNDLIDYVVDKSPHKQGKYLPGSHIPILGEGRLIEYRPDYIIILPWNIKDEIMDQLAYTKEWNCQFVVAIPEIAILK